MKTNHLVFMKTIVHHHFAGSDKWFIRLHMIAERLNTRISIVWIVDTVAEYNDYLMLRPSALGRRSGGTCLLFSELAELNNRRMKYFNYSNKCSLLSCTLSFALCNRTNFVRTNARNFKMLVSDKWQSTYHTLSKTSPLRGSFILYLLPCSLP